MSSCWCAMNHDTSEPSTLNMCNAILKIYQQLQYPANPSHPIASPWKPYQARPISELQATQNGLSTTSSVPHIHTKMDHNPEIQKHRTSTAARTAMYMMGWQYTKKRWESVKFRSMLSNNAGIWDTNSMIIWFTLIHHTQHGKTQLIAIISDLHF